MSRFKRLSSLSPLLVVVLASLSASASCPLRDDLMRHVGISPAGFRVSLPKISAPTKEEIGKDSLAAITLSRNFGVIDGFEHAALIDRDLRIILIHRSGGFFGVDEWYGPVPIDEEVDVENALQGCNLIDGFATRLLLSAGN